MTLQLDLTRQLALELFHLLHEVLFRVLLTVLAREVIQLELDIFSRVQRRHLPQNLTVDRNDSFFVFGLVLVDDGLAFELHVFVSEHGLAVFALGDVWVVAADELAGRYLHLESVRVGPEAGHEVFEALVIAAEQSIELVVCDRLHQGDIFLMLVHLSEQVDESALVEVQLVIVGAQ